MLLDPFPAPGNVFDCELEMAKRDASHEELRPEKAAFLRQLSISIFLLVFTFLGK